MFLRNTLWEILRDQRPPPVAPPEVKRAVAARLLPDPSHALVLTGMRRSGKSTLLAQLMRKEKPALYVNFEDTRLFGLSPEDFPTLLELIDEIAPPPAALFFDEVQELDGWQRLIRGLMDRGHSICLTGSNASLLGRELGAKLTGRHLSSEVFPFGYGEYLRFTKKKRGVASFRSYLDDGGFPGYLRTRNPQILQELLRDVVHRDVAARHNLRETRHVMNLLLLLLANTGLPFSLQRLTKALGVPSVSQTSRYVEYLIDAYLLQSVEKFSPSFRKRAVAPAKYYAIDTGFRHANTPQPKPDLGRRLENAVFLELRRRGERPAYAAETDAWECDLVTEDTAIQVCAEITPENQARELRGLREAMDSSGKRKALVITLDQRDKLKPDGLAVDFVPAWKWMK